MITLREAVDIYRREEGAAANAYEWYRKQAQRDRTVWFGGQERVPVRKERGAWLVDAEAFAHALDGHRARVAEVKRITVDYRAGIMHGGDGASAKTEWGGYRIRGGFHLAWSSYESARHKSNGTWTCNTCMAPAQTEHDHEECHTCSDWGSCGRDCTLSRVLCSGCGTSLAI